MIRTSPCRLRVLLIVLIDACGALMRGASDVPRGSVDAWGQHGRSRLVGLSALQLMGT
jgi:hypothetical protein